MTFLRPLPTLLLLLLLCAPTPVRAGDEPPPPGLPGSLVLEKTVQDYGQVEQDREYAAEVGYRNGGEAPIRNLRAKADCGCYSVALTKTELEPGESGSLTVRFRTHAFRGRAGKTLNLLYDDGEPRLARLKLELQVVLGVLLERLHLGEVLVGTRPEGSVPLLWFEGAGKPFDVASAEIPGEPVDVKVTPYEPKAGSPYRGWVLNLAFREPPAKGVYSKTLVVRTSHPERGEVHVPVTAHVIGKVWVQTSRVYLGLVPQGRSKSAAVAFRGFSPDVRLGRLSARSKKGLLQVAIEDAFGPQGPMKKLRVTVPADAEPGLLDDVIELRTQVPGEERIEIQVRGRVYVPHGR